MVGTVGDARDLIGDAAGAIGGAVKAHGVRSSDVYRPPTRGMGRGSLWFVVVVNAILGGSLLVVAVGVLLGLPADRPWSVGLSVGLAVGAAGWVVFGAVGFHRMYLYRAPADGRRMALETVDGSPAVVLY